MTTQTIMMFQECRRHIKTSYLRTDLIVNSEKFASVPKVTSASSVNLYSFATANSIYISTTTTWLMNTMKTERLSSLALMHSHPGAYEGGPPPPAPSTLAPPERLRGGTHEGGSFNITSACISLPQARHSGLPRGQQCCCPPLGVPDGALPPLENTKLKGNYV